MTTRVLLPFSSTDSSLGRKHTWSKQNFVVIDDADALQIKLATELVQTGHTAGVLRSTVFQPQAVFFDMDATVIAEESLVEIARTAGKQAEIEQLTTQAMAGGMDFATSLRMRLKILRGLERHKVLSIKPHLNPGISEFSSFARSRGIKLFLVSGGFMDLAIPVARDLGFDDVHANRFAWDGDRLAGEVEGEIVDGIGKREAVSRWCKQLGFDPKRCIAVGDGANDLPMMQLCGAAVGFIPKKALWNHLSICNGVGDHRLLLEMIR